MRASTSTLSPGGSSISLTRTTNMSPSETKSLISALFLPSTRTLTVPSGSRSICTIVPTVPTEYMSAPVGSFTLASFWAERNISLLSLAASSRAFMDFSLPTKRGASM